MPGEASEPFASAEKSSHRYAADPSATSPFHVPFFLHAVGGLVRRWRKTMLWLAEQESHQLERALAQHPVRSPIYICGLARSGSTLLHEIVAAHSRVATHRVKDYPLVLTPYWWRRATAGMRVKPPSERLHRDGVMITAESPDALEEMVWMAFFPHCHDSTASSVLTASDRHAAFEAFYDLHLRKLLLAESAERYAAKANYHVARLAYLQRLYPDARFIIPVRSPQSHVASLLRQHRWFSRGQADYPRALAYMQRTGHFEFGLDRRVMHLGDAERVGAIQTAWSAGEEVRGFALDWDMVYGTLQRTLAGDSQLRAASLVVRFESLTAEPEATMRSLLEHCGLPEWEPVVQRFLSMIRPTGTSAGELSGNEVAIVREHTASTAAAWGY